MNFSIEKISDEKKVQLFPRKQNSSVPACIVLLLTPRAIPSVVLLSRRYLQHIVFLF